MPAAGLNRALRPRQTRRARLKRELSWPRPGGMAISLAGAALVFCGAWSLDPTARSTLPSPVVAPVSTPTTPDTSAEPAEPSLTGASSAVTSKAAAHSPRTPASLMGSGGFASPIAPLTSVSEVVGAAAYSGKLHAEGFSVSCRPDQLGRSRTVTLRGRHSHNLRPSRIF